ncbi:hypothetical protein TNCV_2597291 [Trichonephila clavipes]|nr:hypothetical protein TNCV_2597291 [Trichonephila clavipes]
MNDSRGDIRRSLIGSNVGNPGFLGGSSNPFKRDNVEALSKSTEFLYLVYSLKSATCFSEKVLLRSCKCLSFVGFNERRKHRRYIICEWIADKRRSETDTSCCPICLHKRPSYTIDTCTVKCQYRCDFIIHLHKFNCPSCRRIV